MVKQSCFQFFQTTKNKTQMKYVNMTIGVHNAVF